ncbi:immunoglobulin-like domain-containing protein [uncultured Winogradskyella sp.]|uniref:immunoglobulin-like domain-containing protein n=1 Tax=Winogradskyella sp. 4-2091 TaxID=3381659 RepID=UPI00261429FC|nr:immunoglobulin-like domain-containing protein [uncultured Winogradskyella sp.]
MKKNYSNGVCLVLLLLCFLPTYSQTNLQKEQIISRYDLEVIQDLSEKFNEQAKTEKAEAVQMALLNGWPLIIKNENSYLELQKISSEGKPIYYTTYNVDAAESTRTNHLNSGGSLGLNLDGQNMIAHVWDGGLARASHQEYDGAGGSNRFSIGDGTTTLNYHSAHVTGTIIASGVVANAKGMAPQASAVGYEWNNDISEATSAAGNGMLISNHSYGYAARNSAGQPQLPNYYFGGYITDSRDWDEIMFNAPYYLMVVAAGNDGSDNSANGSPLDGNSSYDKLSGHATAKNNMVVANANDANIDANGNLVSVSINSSSSEGPTDDYRIKPDITGNGTGVYSTYESSNTAYNSITGTSMASPNVAGSLLLLQQHANNVNGSYLKASTLKGLALHTADDAGSNGPDAIYGWGLMNTKSAAEAITNNGNESKIEELTLSNGQSYQITVDSDGINDLYASISWTDRAGTATTATNSNSAVLVNDLDIRVSKGVTTYSPWRLTGVSTNGQGDNIKDPYERVDVTNATGTYTITITHKGSLTGGSQNYSLIVTGLSGTPIVCSATTPTGLSIDGFGSSTATVSWDAVPGASYDCRYRESGTSAWTTSSVSGTSTSLSGLTPETSYEVQVRSICADNSTSSYTSSASFTTTEVQLNYCTSTSSNVNDEYISRVQLGIIDNTSGAQFYSDFTNLSTVLNQGESYSITVTPTWTGTTYAEGYSVWIDYNHDGDFSDSGEQVWSQAATQTAPVSGSFLIPSGTYIGNTRMRVSMNYNAVPTECQSFTYGEVEDYTVNLTGGTPDTTAPVITLTGASTINLEVGDTYSELGATATDNIDGNLTSSIVITGTVNTNSAGTYTKYYNVSDAAGNAATQRTRTIIVTEPADTTAPVITLTGASTINLEVGDAYNELGATATDNVDGNLTSSIVITGTVNTNSAGTYTKYYNVSDAAGNAATQRTRSIVVTEPSTGSGCTSGISSFPYSESFENTFGAWTQATGDDFNWATRSGTTPSSNTGPSSADTGSYYIYMESSSPNYSTKRAILNSPCYDLSGVSQATFGFQYHMYGASSMGSLALELSDDDGASWTSIWSASGNQGNSWLSASVNLAAYVGASVQLRFNGVTGTTWQGDMAVDAVSLSAGGGSGSTCADVSLSITFDNYPEETAWSVVDASGSTVASGGTYGSQADGSTLTIDVGCLDVGCYDFVITDTYGDGICCSYGNGSYSLTNSDTGSVLASGGSFTSSETTNFCIGSSSSNFGLNASVIAENPAQYFKVHPNPVKESLTIDLVGYEAQTYEILNMLGQIVAKGRYSSTIDVSKFENGVYILQLNIGEKKQLKRFIKE